MDETLGSTLSTTHTQRLGEREGGEMASHSVSVQRGLGQLGSAGHANTKPEKTSAHAPTSFIF